MRFGITQCYLIAVTFPHLIIIIIIIVTVGLGRHSIKHTGSVLCGQSSDWRRAVAEMAAEPKAEKYHNLSSDHIFQPIAMKNLGAFSSSSLEFLRELGRRLGSLS